MSETQKKRMGRPPVNATPVTVRIGPELLDWLDEQCASAEPHPSRPEMVRRILEGARNG